MQVHSFLQKNVGRCLLVAYLLTSVPFSHAARAHRKNKKCTLDKIRLCGNVYCENHGRCEKSNEKSTCICTPVFTGPFCETVIEQSAPMFIQQNFARQKLVFCGTAARLICKAVGHPAPVIQWLKNHEPLKPGDVYIIKRREFRIKRVNKSHAGEYTCIARNEFGSINRTYELVVIDQSITKPIISEIYPSNTTVEFGKNTLLQCRTLGDFLPHIKWLKHNNSTKPIKLKPTKILYGNCFLMLENVTFDDAGKYTCVASNFLGYDRKSVWLEVVLPEKKETGRKLNMLEESNTRWFAISISLICVIVICSLIMLFIIKYRKKVSPPPIVLRKRLVFTEQNSKEERKPGESLVRIEPLRGQYLDAEYLQFECEMPEDSEWEFPREKLSLGEKIGEGAFGQVVQATAEGITNEGEIRTVAVKMLKDGHSEEDMASFASEMQIMKLLGRHPHIINLLGCCSQNGALFMIVEFAVNGSLGDYLQSKRMSSGYEIPEEKVSCKITERELLSFARQVASGMEHISSLRLLHRDLAARNVLVMDDLTIKIADFGLARDVRGTYFYRKLKNGPLPVKWMAIEALINRVFTTKNDVWAFGILLWEIWTLGGVPYPSLPVEELYNTLAAGYRMTRPKHCSVEVYAIMRACWEADPDDRPTFQKLVIEFDELLDTVSNQEDVAICMPAEEDEVATVDPSTIVVVSCEVHVPAE